MRRLWNRLPLAGRSQLVGLFMATLLVGLSTFVLAYEDQFPTIVVLAEPLPTDVSLWPACKRLTPGSDGCTYTVTKGLSWNDAAQALGQNPRELMAVNHHLAGRSSLYRGDNLIVWRNRIRLEN